MYKCLPEDITKIAPTIVVDYMQLSVSEVLKFLHSLKPKGFSYSIMNSARFAMSAFSTLEVIKATKVCKYSVCKCYIGLPRNIRGDQTELFITTTKTIP